MALYFYRALSQNGKKVTGQIDASSEESVRTELLSKKLYPIEIKPSKESKESFLPQSVYGSNNRLVRQSNTATSDSKKKNGTKSLNSSTLSNTLPSSLGNTGNSSIGSTTPTGKISPKLGSSTAESNDKEINSRQDPPFLHTNAPTLTSDGNVITRV